MSTGDLNYDRINDYGAVRISLASPHDIRSWSFGEVKKPETINYRTYRPEKDGLFCERIFGPEKDWECACGKYRGMKYKGMICDRCGVKVTHSRVRRKRMGHIELAAPVVHIWFFKAMPSRLGTLLDMKTTSLEKIIYFQDYVVVNAGDSPLKERQLLSEDEFYKAQDEYGNDSFTAEIGAEAIRKLLNAIDLAKLRDELRVDIADSNGGEKQKKLVAQFYITLQREVAGWLALGVTKTAIKESSSSSVSPRRTSAGSRSTWRRMSVPALAASSLATAPSQSLRSAQSSASSTRTPSSTA